MISNGTTLSCSIEFYGEWVPTIKWSRSDGNQVDHANSSAYNEKVTSTLTTQLKLCKVNDASTSSSDMTSKTKTPAGVKFTAYVYFNETNRPAKVTAMNIPTVPADVAEWTSPPLCIAASEGWSDLLPIFLVCLQPPLTFFRRVSEYFPDGISPSDISLEYSPRTCL